MGKIYTIASGKGGVGKTTLTVNLGAAIADFGKEVIIIDADLKMANVEILLNMASRPITLQDVLAGHADIKDAIYEYEKLPNLKIVPAGLSLEGLRNINVGMLPEVIRSLRDAADIILIDTPPGLEEGFKFALQTTDELILVTMPTTESLADTLKVKIITERVGVPVLGAVVNMVHRDRMEISKEDIETVLECKVLAEIPFDTEVKRAAACYEPIVIRNPRSAAAEVIRKLAADLIGVKYELERPRSLFSRLGSLFKR
ncbi:MAG: P-loop NTPase [bacterium]|nr:P-loop NTPase [bacterium]